MKLDALTTQLTRIDPVIKLAKRYAVFLFMLLFLGIYIALVQRIGSLIESEPVPPANTESPIKPISRLKIDEEAVNQMTKLESQNIEVQTLFDQARQNPFTE